jgi:hypothetical protein
MPIYLTLVVAVVIGVDRARNRIEQVKGAASRELLHL